MWLIILSLTAAIVTAIWYVVDNKKYMLNFLCLILWGSSIMVFVDHIMGYLNEGGDFIEMTANATLLGIVLIIVAIIIWEVMLIIKKPKNISF